MIYTSKTYAENIAREENKHYHNLCQSLILNGKIEDKYKMLLDTDDIVNIIILSVLQIHDNCQIEENKLREANGKLANVRLTVFKPDKEHLGRVAKLFDTLTTDIKERVMFSFGLDLIVKLELDEVPQMKKVLRGLSNRFLQNTNNPPPKKFANNVEK